MVTVRGPRRASSRQRACARHHGVSAIFLHQISFHFDFFLYSLPLRVHNNNLPVMEWGGRARALSASAKQRERTLLG